MKCVRLILTQTSANYKKEETDKNKMTYPLPPFSTVIGAIHNACGYTKTHNMDISIQGSFESMGKEAYRDYCFLNSTMDDRGILVKMNNPDMLSTAYTRVASAKKSMGNSFKKGITIKVENPELLQEYRDLKDLSESIKEFKDNRLKPVLNMLKNRKAKFANLKKQCNKNSSEYKEFDRKEKRIKSFEKEINQRMKEYELKNFTIPISKFRSLTTSLKMYEVLYGIELVIHIRAEESVMNDIMDNIYNLKSIGRSEDFVDIKEAEIVELYDEINNEVASSNSAYLSIDAVRENYIGTKGRKNSTIIGTKYNMNKLYEIIDNKRVFKDKKKVLYTSGYCIEECNPDYNLFYDGKYIVNFI
ncbi:MAG: CRISPR-associated protein Cas5 [Lachnospirales bacterium]